MLSLSDGKIASTDQTESNMNARSPNKTNDLHPVVYLADEIPRMNGRLKTLFAESDCGPGLSRMWQAPDDWSTSYLVNQVVGLHPVFGPGFMRIFG
jgi:hypothetical protein